MHWIREHINKIPSFSSFESHIATIEVSVDSNPALCIETCKSLIEGICKTILTNQDINYTEYDKFRAAGTGVV